MLTLLSALYRLSMLRRLLSSERATPYITALKTAYGRQPRTVQLAAAAATLAVLAWVLLS